MIQEVRVSIISIADQIASNKRTATGCPGGGGVRHPRCDSLLKEIILHRRDIPMDRLEFSKIVGR